MFSYFYVNIIKSFGTVDYKMDSLVKLINVMSKIQDSLVITNFDVKPKTLATLEERKGE